MNATSRAILQAIRTSDSSLSSKERIAMQRLIDGIVDTDPGDARCLGKTMLVTQQVAARMLSVSRATIWRMARAGLLKPVEILPGTFRYAYREVVALAAQGGEA